MEGVPGGDNDENGIVYRPLGSEVRSVAWDDKFDMHDASWHVVCMTFILLDVGPAMTSA